MRKVTQDELERLSRAAQKRSRLRKNLNLHASYDEVCQRLFNAVEPGSYVRPHRHLDPPKTETFLPIRGRFLLVTFTDGGDLSEVVLLGQPGGEVAAEIPAGRFHTILALEPGSVCFEAKPGPYRPLADKDWAAWSPAEGEEGAAAYLEEVERLAKSLAEGRAGRPLPTGKGGLG